MITLPREVVQQAYDALLGCLSHLEKDQTRAALRAALEQPQRDPFIKERQQLEQEWCDLRAMKVALEQPQAEREIPMPQGYERRDIAHDYKGLFYMEHQVRDLCRRLAELADLRDLQAIRIKALEQPQAEPAASESAPVPPGKFDGLDPEAAVALLREARDALVGMGVFGTLMVRIDALLPRSEGDKT